MKSEKSIVRLILILLVVLVAAGVLYSVLSSRFAPTTITPVASGPAQTVNPENLPDAPDFTMEDADGNLVKLSDFLGEKPVIVNFWASWCPPCKGELPDFETAYQTYGDRVQFLMVDLADGAQETKAAAQAFIQNEGFTFPVYFDTMGQAVAGYSIYSIPVTVAITADGKLLQSQTGALSAPALESIIAALLSD